MMKKHIKTSVIALCVLIILIALVFVVTKPSKDVIATVDGESITKDEFATLYSRVIMFNPDVPKEQILDQLISNKALVLEAKRLNVAVTDDEVKGVIALTESLYGNITALLANSSISYDTFLSKIREQLVISKLLNQTIKVDDPTEDELRKTYVNNTAYFTIPASINVSHILVKSEEEANDIKERIDGGADFYEIASKKSIDPSAKLNAGNLGPIQRGATVPEFENVAFSLPAGTISEPVKSQFGYHLIKVEGKLREKKLSYSDVKDQLKGLVIQQKQQDAIMKYVKSITANVKVKKYLDRI